MATWTERFHRWDAPNRNLPAEVLTEQFNAWEKSKMARKANTQTQATLLPSLDTPSQPPDAMERLKPEGSALETEAESLTVTDHKSSEHAGLFLKTIVAFRKKVAELCDPVCEAANLAHKAATKLRSTLDAPGHNAEIKVKFKLGTYLDAQEAVRREEEHRRNCEAMKAAQDKAESDAELLDAIGDTEAAEAVMTAPVYVAPVIIAPVAKPEGISRVQNWKWRVIDASKIPDSYWILDEVKINGVVRAMKEAAPTAIPGIESYDAGTVRVG